eukprot:GHVT01041586.1.p1 GENE.GHVT01041586.1~~GHVT01041586.1.p1  ORF type:complete len:446 (+),score=47.40 GHVT01041586.1:338-1675(+)
MSLASSIASRFKRAWAKSKPAVGSVKSGCPSSGSTGAAARPVPRQRREWQIPLLVAAVGCLGLALSALPGPQPKVGAAPAVTHLVAGKKAAASPPVLSARLTHSAANLPPSPAGPAQPSLRAAAPQSEKIASFDAVECVQWLGQERSSSGHRGRRLVSASWATQCKAFALNMAAFLTTALLGLTAANLSCVPATNLYFCDGSDCLQVTHMCYGNSSSYSEKWDTDMSLCHYRLNDNSTIKCDSPVERVKPTQASSTTSHASPTTTGPDSRTTTGPALLTTTVPDSHPTTVPDSHPTTVPDSLTATPASTALALGLGLAGVPGLIVAIVALACIVRAQRMRGSYNVVEDESAADGDASDIAADSDASVESGKPAEVQNDDKNSNYRNTLAQLVIRVANAISCRRGSYTLTYKEKLSVDESKNTNKILEEKVVPPDQFIQKLKTTTV